ncbi:hypothetical protein GOODEAATRI_018631 [Goodea atripinnis]|uniref:Uncharacterized protein n=1 Tax=Goodea atripinnis TaxID=208336 RepID=A0ABV0P5Y9_9TELE
MREQLKMWLNFNKRNDQSAQCSTCNMIISCKEGCTVGVWGVLEQITGSKSLSGGLVLGLTLPSPVAGLYPFPPRQCGQGLPTVISGGSSGPNPKLGRTVPSGAPHTKISSMQVVGKRRGKSKELYSVH